VGVVGGWVGGRTGNNVVGQEGDEVLLWLAGRHREREVSALVIERRVREVQECPGPE